MPESDPVVKKLLKQSDDMFDERLPMMSLWQEIADNFYVERADFTSTRSLGYEFSDHLTTSMPLRAHRDLSNAISSTLRPSDRVWFNTVTDQYDNIKDEAKEWLEIKSRTLYNALYDEKSGFTRATDEADGDIAAFGMAIISCEMNWKDRALLFKSWHLKDVAWVEDDARAITRIDRKWKPTAQILHDKFSGNVHRNIKKLIKEKPSDRVDVRHVFMLAEELPSKEHRNKKYVSVYYDIENEFEMERTYTDVPMYMIARWKTLSNTQYAFSPAVMNALSDARMAQDMALVMLEAGQKQVDPPMLAVDEAINSDYALFAGGITTVDADYDERLGDVMRPLHTGGNTQLGEALLESVKEDIREAFFLNKVGLPPLNGGMSPFEVSQRVNEYVQAALPLFGPLESEYNAGILSLAWEVGMANGLFGSPQEIPEELLGSDIKFRFTNPLREAVDRVKGNLLLESTSVINQMAAYDQSVPLLLDVHAATRDVLDGMGAPRIWFKTEAEFNAEVEAQAQQAQQQALLETLQQGAETAKTVGEAGQELQGIRNI